MLIAVIILGFGVVAFQLGALRTLLVTQIKQQIVIIGLIEQLEGVTSDGLIERAQAEIDIAAGKYE